MGKPIVYCGQCGKSLPEKEFDRGRAQILDNTPFCSTCRPIQTAPERMPERPSSGKHPAMSKYLRGVGGRPAPSHPKWLLPAGIGLGVILLLAIAAAMSGGNSPAPPPEPTPAVVRPSPPPPGPTSAPAPTPPPPRPAPPPLKSTAEQDREFKEQLDKENAAKFERFLAQLREIIDTGWRLALRREEIEGMFASALKSSGERKGEVEKLKEEYDRKAALLGYWTLDETSGETVQDATGNGHDGELAGAPSRVPGRRKGSFQFNGTRDGVTVQKTEGLSPQVEAGELTLSAWVRVTKLPSTEGQGRAPIVAKGDVRAWEYALYVHASGILEFVVWMPDGSNHVSVAGGKAEVDQWHHLAGVYEKNKQARLLVDGKEVGRTAAFAGATGSAGAPLAIGCRADGRQFLAGRVDDVRVYRKALDDKSLQALGNGQ